MLLLAFKQDAIERIICEILQFYLGKQAIEDIRMNFLFFNFMQLTLLDHF
jgi:hypothetical protein